MASNLRNGGPSMGDNSDGMIDGALLKTYVERVARLMTAQKEIGDDIKELCQECDEAGACSKKELRRLGRESLMDSVVLTSNLERMATLRAAVQEQLDLFDPPEESVVKLQGRRRQKKGDESDLPAA